MARPLEQFNVGVMSAERSVDIPRFSKTHYLKLYEAFYVTDFIIKDIKLQKNLDYLFKKLPRIQGPIFNCYISLKQIEEDECLSVSCSVNNELDFMHSYQLACTLSLKNIDGCLKFPQSFVMDGTMIHELINSGSAEEFVAMENYISRKNLLEESAEFLPQDTLSLHFEVCIDYCVRQVAYKRPLHIRSWASKKGYLKYSSTDTKLNLNSAIYPSLCKGSICFQGLHESGMGEEKEGWLNIPSYEVEHFAAMLYFIEYGTLHFVRDEKISMLSDPLLERILKLYTLADKYGVLKLQSFCRDFLMKYALSKKNAEKVCKSARLCYDQTLKSYCKRYIPKMSSSEQAVKKLKLKYTKKNQMLKKVLPRKKKNSGNSTCHRHHQYEYEFYR